MRVEIGMQSWGWVADTFGNARVGASVVITNLDASPAAVWSAITGGTQLTSPISTNTLGLIPGFIEQGSYLVSVDLGQIHHVEAISAGGSGDTHPFPISYTTGLQTALDTEVSARGTADSTHAALTTTAHGGLVAGTDSRLTNARTPTTHANTHAGNGGDPIQGIVGHVMRLGTSVVCSNSVVTTITMDTAGVIDNAVYFALSGGGLQCKVSGLYLISYGANMVGGTSGSRNLQLLQNGGGVHNVGVTGTNARPSGSVPIRCAANDLIVMVAFADGGSGTTVVSGAIDTFITGAWMGA